MSQVYPQDYGVLLVAMGILLTVTSLLCRQGMVSQLGKQLVYA